MDDSASRLVSPRRLILWYLALAMVGLVLMVTAGNSDRQSDPLPRSDVDVVQLAPVTTAGG